MSHRQVGRNRTATLGTGPLPAWAARLALVLALWVPALAARAAEGPPEAPLLRLETGTHTAIIQRIAADAAGRWLASVADDKTLRLWDAHSGAPLRVIRPPGGEGNEGKLYAVAMDPGGDWVAAGGWTKLGYEGPGNHNILIFDPATGRLTRRIPGLENVVNHLCVAPDGSRLAAVLGAGAGLRVYDPGADFREVFADRDYGANALGCAFGPDGSLVAASYDGDLRLYRPEGGGLSRVARVPAQGGRGPHAVAFHPDGSRIAVGFSDSTRVALVDGRDLSPRGEADATGIDNGDLSSVAWSRDGSRLLAGGLYRDGKGRPVLSWPWSNGQPGRRAVWAAADNTVMDLAALPEGGVAVGTGDPALLVLDPDGRAALDLRPVIANLRGKLGDAFRVSADGQRIAFGLGYGSKDPVWLDLAERRLARGAPAADGLKAPRTQAPGLDIQGWQGTTEPKLDGKPLALKKYEMARSLAIAADGQRFLLGADWSLRLFERTGKEIWKRPVPGAAWGVNLTADGRLALAAFGDGTVRWYRVRDGQELLALFPHQNGTDWVAWTPAGYYDASPGGDRLIGWQVNRGGDSAADFFPAAQLRGRFYRPEVVAAVLGTLDESQALAQSGVRPQPFDAAALPPTVELLAPAAGERFDRPEVVVRLRIAGPAGEPVTALYATVDGQRLPLERGLARLEPGTLTRTLTLPPHDLTLGLIAENRFGASTPAAVRLTWAGERAAFVVKPKLYALAVGVGEYRDPGLKLTYPVKDARDFAAALKSQGGGLYREVEVRVLADPKAAEVMDGLDWLRAQVTGKDIGMLFLAGHGTNDTDGDYYFLPADVDTARLRRTAVSYFEIKKTLTGLPGKVLAFVDTCHSGNVMGGRAGPVDLNAVVNDLAAAENGIVVFASATGKQLSLEDPAWGNGAFAKALVEGLQGKANYTGSGTVTVNQLDLYLSERVKALTGNRQTPATRKPDTMPDFPIAVVR